MKSILDNKFINFSTKENNLFQGILHYTQHASLKIHTTKNLLKFCEKLICYSNLLSFRINHRHNIYVIFKMFMKKKTLFSVINKFYLKSLFEFMKT